MRPLFRPGTVYGVSVVDIHLAYVGKTRHRDYRRRIDQHLRGCKGTPPKPWADIYTGDFILWTSQRVSTPGLAIREWWYIRRPLGPMSKRPVFNVKHNRDYPHRIPPWTARQQRQERDAARTRG